MRNKAAGQTRFGRYDWLGWRGTDEERRHVTFCSPGDVALSPSQRATAWFFIIFRGLREKLRGDSLGNMPYLFVSYYEIGTGLTVNHGHTAMFGVYGMLAVALLLFCLRYIVRPDRWSTTAEKISFWPIL